MLETTERSRSARRLRMAVGIAAPFVPLFFFGCGGAGVPRPDAPGVQEARKCLRHEDCAGANAFCKNPATPLAACVQCGETDLWSGASQSCLTPACFSHGDCPGDDAFCRNPGLENAVCVTCDGGQVWDSASQACAPRPCNGFPELCGRPFNEISFPTTHNAMSSRDENWGLPNQERGLVQQLNDGVRAFMLDLHYYENEVYLCHGVCSDLLGREKFTDGLNKFAGFLDANPNEVIAFIFESYVNWEDVENDFDEAGLTSLALVQPEGGPWPTLGQMIDAGTRIVALTDDPEMTMTPPWRNYVWSYAWETDWDVQDIGEFACDRNRGGASNPLFILNNFITTSLGPSPTQAAKANANPFLIDRALQCWGESGQIPNFVTVDFYDRGDLFEAVNRLNGVGGAD